MRVGSISTCSNPADVSLSRYSLSSSAPATHPSHSNTFCRICASTSPRVTTSETASRPPGLSTRKASRNTASLSAERLTTQFEMITSTELSGSGICSISPRKNSTFSAPALRLFLFASASISSVMYRLYYLPVAAIHAPYSFSRLGVQRLLRSFFPSTYNSKLSIEESRLDQAVNFFDSRNTMPSFLSDLGVLRSFFFAQPSTVDCRPLFLRDRGLRTTASLRNIFRLQRLVPRAALRIEELQQFLQRFRVRRVTQKRARALHKHEPFILQLVQMVR